MRRKSWVLVWMLMLALCIPAGAETLKINTSIKPPFSTAAQDGFFDRLLSELFGRIGVDFELIRLPTERALQMANDGFSDADLPRISGLEKKYQNLIEVPEPVIDYNFVAFMREPTWQDISWQKLKKQRVGLIIGWKIYEKNVPLSAERTLANSPQQLFQLLSHDRVRVALYERYAGKYLVKTSGLKKIVEAQPPLAVRPMHIYLNRKNEALSEIISAELRKMKADGSWQQIVNETLLK